MNTLYNRFERFDFRDLGESILHVHLVIIMDSQKKLMKKFLCFIDKSQIIRVQLLFY